MKSSKSSSRVELKVGSKLEIVDNDIDTFFEKTVTSFGTGAKLDCPKEHLGKKAYVIIRKKD